jgi:hypothetical protein
MIGIPVPDGSCALPEDIVKLEEIFTLQPLFPTQKAKKFTTRQPSSLH